MTDVHALSGAYAIDALDDPERTQFEDHLAECVDCRDEVLGLQETGAQLSMAAQTTPPPDLRGRVLADIATVRPLPPRVPSLDERRSRRLARRLPALAVAAAVLTAVGIGGVVWNAVDDPASEAPRADVPSPSATLDAVDTVLAAPDAEQYDRDLDGGGSVIAIHSRELGQVAVIAEGLPRLPSTKVYEMWLRLDGEMIPAGLMTTTDGTLILDGDAAGAEAVGITVEAAGGSPKGVPTTQPIVYLPLESA